MGSRSRGLARRVDAKEDADTERHQQSDEDAPQLDLAGHADGQGDALGDGDAEEDSNGATNERQHRTFNQELAEHIARARPSALRMPISRVRSVTLTSMMFMMTMPPTSSEMEASATATTKKLPLKFDHRERKLWLVSMTKLSGAPGVSWRRLRTTARTWSMAASMGAPTP